MNTHFEDVRCRGSIDEVSHKSQILGPKKSQRSSPGDSIGIGKETESQEVAYETQKKENDARRRCPIVGKDTKRGCFVLNENVTGTLK